MLDKLIKASTDYLLRKQVIGEEERDVYEYGFQALYNNIIDIVSIAVIAILLHQVLQTIFYHISFVLLRKVAGGFHSKTHLRCFIFATTMWLLSLWGIAHTVSVATCVCLAICSLLLIWGKAPIEHKNSPLSVDKYNRMKKASRVLSVILFISIIFIAFVMSPKYLWIATSLAYGMLSHLILMLLALVEVFFNRKNVI